MVVIRLRVQGRKHRHFYRMCAMDKRQPNDGRFIEELGTYDPHVKDNDKTCTLKPDRIKYWLSVGA
ncbi:MAG TPA: 30S ribosomal protein S16, partial [Gemmatales bacterium]|nr:30S ribosomal protein S16 [Gemmatales bacterium]